MRFTETPLAGAFVIDLERMEDPRGFFARTYCQREFAERGLHPKIVQCNVSWNRTRGTLRGLHYQAAPHEEAKLVSCSKGEVFDVLVDLRPDSKTFRRWFSIRLSADRANLVYVPEGFAHGFQSLVDDTVVFYQMSEFFRPELARGIVWNDPSLAIAWPVENPVVSERDAALPRISD